MGAHAWSNAKATLGAQLKDGKLNFLCNGARRRTPRYRRSPTRGSADQGITHGPSSDQRMLVLFNSSMSLGRPGSRLRPMFPAERVQALRHAFAETMRDPELLERARKAIWTQADVR